MSVIPIGALIAVLWIPSTEPMSSDNEIFISKGTLRHSTGNSYLSKDDGRAFRLYCPQLPLDRHRRDCFVDNIWEMQGISVVVTHDKPIEWGIPKVVVCDVRDAAGKSLLREELKISCQNSASSRKTDN